MDIQPIRRARPHLLRAAAAAIIALAGFVTARFGQMFHDGRPKSPDFDAATASERTIAAIGAAVLLLAGIFAIRALARAGRSAMDERAGDARGSTLGLLISAIGYVVLALMLLSAIGVRLESFLLGGALTGVVVGIAAQQTLANFLAGIVLLVVRPFTVGEYIVLRSGPLGGEYEGTVAAMGLFYVEMVTAQGPVQLPNAGVIAAAIGPGARSVSTDRKEVEDEAPPSEGGSP